MVKFLAVAMSISIIAIAGCSGRSMIDAPPSITGNTDLVAGYTYSPAIAQWQIQTRDPWRLIAGFGTDVKEAFDRLADSEVFHLDRGSVCYFQKFLHSDPDSPLRIDGFTADVLVANMRDRKGNIESFLLDHFSQCFPGYEVELLYSPSGKSDAILESSPMSFGLTVDEATIVIIDILQFKENEHGVALRISIFSIYHVELRHL